MSRLKHFSPLASKTLMSILSLIFLVLIVHVLLLPAYGAQLGYRSLKLSDDQISAKANYLLSFDLTSSGMLGSVVVQFCSNSPLIGDPCVAPVGLDATGAMLGSQTGATGFSISSSSTVNQLILTRLPAMSPAGMSSYQFADMINPSSPGSYYVRLQTFATSDASGPASDYGGIAFAILNSVAISAEVPPYLLFCTGVTISGLNCTNAVGDYIDFGELGVTRASSASSQMLVATNAQSGYGVTVAGTTLASGINSINALATGDVSRPGVSQFGFNLSANTTPAGGSSPIGPGIATAAPLYGQPNIYRFNSGDTIVSNPKPDDVRVFTISYIVNRPVNQAPGIYVCTMTYIALATF